MFVFSTDSNVGKAAVIRNSQYFQSIPLLPLHCSELDGDALTTPVVFEDVYCDAPPLKQCSSSFFTSETHNSSDRCRTCRFLQFAASTTTVRRRRKRRARPKICLAFNTLPLRVSSRTSNRKPSYDRHYKLPERKNPPMLQAC